jgi:FAD/FMN-containing dehydrogenase
VNKLPLRSWGLPGPFPHRIAEPDPYRPSDLEALREQAGAASPPCSWLAFGQGRSYGDAGLNTDQIAVPTCRWDRIVSFDDADGIVVCESGVTLDRLVAFALPRGWFPAVLPGTRYVTIGGAIANDVHGKNHHAMGSFGDHVEWIELWRSDRGKLRCSREQAPELFHATIAGLGLTGIILRAGLRLRKVSNGWMQVRTLRFSCLEQFLELDKVLSAEHEYTVAWLDCAAAGKRGIYFAGNHAEQAPRDMAAPVPPRQLSFGVTPPFSLINRLSGKLFNQAYWSGSKSGDTLQSIYPYFFPLDAIGNWNRIYGPRGFYQYQCVLPGGEPAAAQAILDAIAASGESVFLAVLKTFGARAAPGWLSFARPGLTLALDFPNRGDSTLALFSRLNAIVSANGGALYPAKDAQMPASLFQSAYPRWAELESMRDPSCSSSFWRRVTPFPIKT